MSRHEKINYVELPSRNLKETRAFFDQVFAWTFEEYGPEYLAFSDGVLDGGFYKADKESVVDSGSALIVFYSEELEKTRKNIRDARGSIIREIFSFPGGRRFHFTEPSGNEFAVWSDRE